MIRKKCNTCNSTNLTKYKMSTNPIRVDELNDIDFKVTNKDYGTCLEMVECGNCKLVQPSYEISYKQIIKMYSSVRDEEYLGSSGVRGSSTFCQISKILEKYLDSSSSLMEIGSGSGSLLKLLREHFPKAEGIEPNLRFCSFAKKKYKISIKNIGYESLKFNKKYDAIIALDVIEHVASPANFMKAVNKLLNSNGVCLLVTPNKNSTLAKLTKSKWWHVRPPHLFYFNDYSLSYLANRYGFEVKEMLYFYWKFPIYYIIDSLQKWIFKKNIFNLKFLSISVKLNTFDSKIYLLKKINDVEII